MVTAIMGRRITSEGAQELLQQKLELYPVMSRGIMTKFLRPQLTKLEYETALYESLYTSKIVSIIPGEWGTPLGARYCLTKYWEILTPFREASVRTHYEDFLQQALEWEKEDQREAQTYRTELVAMIRNFHLYPILTSTAVQVGFQKTAKVFRANLNLLIRHDIIRVRKNSLPMIYGEMSSQERLERMLQEKQNTESVREERYYLRKYQNILAPFLLEPV